LEYTLPGGALATFTWKAHGSDRWSLLDFRGMTASPDAAATVDDDATTRWTTGAAQQPGQTLTVDLGRVRSFRRVVLDTGADTGDFPRGYALSTSSDGTHWSDAVTGSGSGQLTAIDLPPTRARFVRVVQTGTAPNWWSVADLRLYDQH
jgi:glucosylceramidase